MNIPPAVLFNYRNTLVTHFSNGVSIIFCLIALLVVTVISVMNRKLNKSIPFRLSIIILISDLFFSIFLIISVHSESNVVCFISTVGFLFMTLITLLYTVAITLNIQLTIVFKYYCGRYFRIALYIVPLIVSIIISILPLAMGQISLAGGSCWFKESTTEGTAWAYGTNYGWIIFTILFCLIVFLSVTFYLVIQRSIFKSSFGSLKSGSLEIKTRTIIKLMMYPLVPIVCYFCLIVKLVLNANAIVLDPQSAYVLEITYTFFKGSQGLLNSTIFLFNTLLYKEAKQAFQSISIRA